MDREKVIKGLECCLTDNPSICEGCPYLETGCLENVRHFKHDILLDALALLKAQEPRLVTEKDFENADAYGYIPAWCETKDDLYCECIVVAALEEEGCRYWTSKPTKEQMEAVKWE